MITNMSKDNGIVEINENNLEGVINLSTAIKKEESKAMKHQMTNGEIENGGSSPSQSLQDKVSAQKRKSKCLTESTVPQMMMMAPQQAITPQQMQHLLQQQLVNPQHLQQMMQQHSLVMQQQAQHKVQEQMMQQLNEQLQINILQQSQLLQQTSVAGKKQDPKQTAAQLQQLQLQQQQLIQQIQLQQRQYFLAQGLMGLPQVPGGQGLMTPVEMQQLWKEVQAHQTAREGGPEEAKVSSSGAVMAASSPPMASLPHLPPHLQSPHSAPQAIVPNGLPEGGTFHMTGVMNPMIPQMNEKSLANGAVNNTSSRESKSPTTTTEESASKEKTHALYGHGVCKWPGCDTPCDTYHAFHKHITDEHQLDDRSTAQTRVQMQVVNQLELQLAKEKERLQAMMQHLHMKPNAPELCGSLKSDVVPKARPTPPQLSPEVAKLPPPPPAMPLVTSTPTLSLPTPGIAPMTLPVYTAPSTPQPLTPHSVANVNHLSGLPTQTPPSSGPVRRRVSDKCNLPISAEIQRNREFYKYSDVRPPFTYASLIRQGIIESPEKQLTLNEIYQWFMNTFAFFRKNQATWKNAVRHNLSLHKCFMRVENVKGAVWTVDEAEFYKRRPQKMGGNIQLKGSGDCLRAPNHYVHSLTSSMRAAMGESGAPQTASLENSVDEDCMAEDLSMTSQTSHGDLSGSADLSHRVSEDLPEHGDIAQDLMVARGVSPSPRDNIHDQPEDLRTEQSNGSVHMMEPEEPEYDGPRHPAFVTEQEKENIREPAIMNGLPGEHSPPQETLVPEIGHGASLPEGMDPVKVISVQPQIHDDLEERDENEAPVHSNVLEN